MFASVASQFMSVIDEANGEVKMDILIKGMEMPKERKMFVIEADGSVWVQIKDTSYFCTGTKAVALPEHGRLISDTDVKALLHSGLSLDTDSDMDYVCGLIDGLPTIVEATE